MVLFKMKAGVSVSGSTLHAWGVFFNLIVVLF
jgi:hypothetical protein